MLTILLIALSFKLGWELHQPEAQFLLEMKCPDCPETNLYCHCTVPLYENLFNKVSNRDYTINTYDCSNMSYDLNRLLKQNGYDSRVKCGQDETSAHAWVELHLFLDPAKNLILKQQPDWNQYSYDVKNCDS